MKALEPTDPRCFVCDQLFSNTDIVVVIGLPDGRPGAVHMQHRGVRELVEHPSQVTIGALFNNIALSMKQGLSSDEAFDLFAKSYKHMSPVMRARLDVYASAGKVKDV